MTNHITATALKSRKRLKLFQQWLAEPNLFKTQTKEGLSAILENEGARKNLNALSELLFLYRPEWIEELLPLVFKKSLPHNFESVHLALQSSERNAPFEEVLKKEVLLLFPRFLIFFHQNIHDNSYGFNIHRFSMALLDFCLEHHIPIHEHLKQQIKTPEAKSFLIEMAGLYRSLKIDYLELFQTLSTKQKLRFLATGHGVFRDQMDILFGHPNPKIRALTFQNFPLEKDAASQRKHLFNPLNEAFLHTAIFSSSHQLLPEVIFELLAAKPELTSSVTSALVFRKDLSFPFSSYLFESAEENYTGLHWLFQLDQNNPDVPACVLQLIEDKLPLFSSLDENKARFLMLLSTLTVQQKLPQPMWTKTRDLFEKCLQNHLEFKKSMLFQIFEPAIKQSISLLSQNILKNGLDFTPSSPPKKTL
jgi:hypothetical protein